MHASKSKFPIVHATRIPAAAAAAASGTSAFPSVQQQRKRTEPTASSSAAAAKDASSAAEAEDANDLLYHALLQRKQLEQQRVSAILHDTRIITDAMVQKQREAQQSKLVVSAAGMGEQQYVSNARYIQINSGLDPKIRVYPGTQLSVFLPPASGLAV